MLAAAGHDVVHTSDMPLGNRTPDRDIVRKAMDESRTVVTKDADFVESYLISGLPQRLLLVSTGNISNDALVTLFERYLPDLMSNLERFRFVELSSDALIAHE